MKHIPPISIKMLATCQECGLEQIIPGINHDHCVQTLRRAGWDHDYLQGTETCPACLEKARANPRADRPAWMPSSTG